LIGNGTVAHYVWPQFDKENYEKVYEDRGDLSSDRFDWRLLLCASSQSLRCVATWPYACGLFGRIGYRREGPIIGATGRQNGYHQSRWRIPFPCHPGFYTVKVEKGSFKTADVKGVEVVTGKTSNLRVGMVAGQQTEVVEVIGSAITVDTTSTAVAANLTDTFYNSVP